MILIYGKKNQNKLSYAIKQFDLKDNDIFQIDKMTNEMIAESRKSFEEDNKAVNEYYQKMLEESKINLIKSIKCINHLENFIYNCLLENKNVISEFQKLEKHFTENFIVIMEAFDNKLNESYTDEFYKNHSDLLEYIQSSSNEKFYIENDIAVTK